MALVEFADNQPPYLNANNLNNNFNELNTIRTYSTTETVIGTWINGKPLYRKVINFGSLPNNSSKSVSHGISNLSRVVSLSGIAYIDDTNITTITLPHADKDGVQYAISLRADKTDVLIVTGSNRTSLNGIVIIEYTKSTD